MSSMEVGAVNIMMPPPRGAEHYSKLLHAAFAGRHRTKLRGDWVGMIGSCRDEEETGYVRGEFYKYIDLQATRDWFNVQKGKKAEAADLAEIRIPDHLKPHFQFLPYVFMPKSHRLFFVVRDREDSLTPRQAHKVLAQALGAGRIATQFGEVQVVIEQSRESLRSIFSEQRLRSLTIQVTPPNPLGRLERELFDSLNKQGVKKQTVILEAGKDGHIVPSKHTVDTAEVALSNGKVVAVVGARGQRKTISTSDHPFTLKLPFMDAVELRSEKLVEAAKAMLAKITRGRKDEH